MHWLEEIKKKRKDMKKKMLERNIIMKNVKPCLPQVSLKPFLSLIFDSEQLNKKSHNNYNIIMILLSGIVKFLAIYSIFKL